MQHNPRCAARHMGLWLMEPLYMQQAVSAIKAGLWPMAQVERSEVTGQPLYRVEAPGIAMIRIDGPTMKGYSKFGGTSTVETRRAIHAAERDPDVSAILTVWDSPGGHFAGTAELAADVANATKPMYAYVEDQAASAALWGMSGARQIAANETAEVGSIGVVAVVEDTSGMADMMGVKVHVISTGEYKGAFVDGAPVTDTQLAYAQERVDEAGEFFIQGLARNRKGAMTPKQVRAIADGRMFGAAEAKEFGLIDAIMPFEQYVAQIAKEVDKAKNAESRTSRMRAAQIATLE